MLNKFRVNKFSVKKFRVNKFRGKKFGLKNCYDFDDLDLNTGWTN